MICLVGFMGAGKSSALVELAAHGLSTADIDRLVEMADGFWVLDYKSGRRDAALVETYRTQMESYRAAVMALYPGKTARCGLVFSDGDMLEI